MYELSTGDIARGKNPAVVIRYRVEALLRGDEPGRRAVTDTRDLARLVRYLPEGSGIRIVMHSVGGSSLVRVWLDVFGVGASTIAPADLAYACALSLVLEKPVAIATTETLPVITHAFEIARITATPMFAASLEEFATQPDWFTDAKSANQFAPTQPKPSLDAAGELLGALTRTEHDTWVVTVLAAPSALDRSLVLDEVDSAIARSGRAAYAGAIVSARTVVASTGPISPAVLAGLAKRSTEVEAVPLEPRSVLSLFVSPAQAVQGHAVAEGHALALARIPAAGSGTQLGIPSRLPNPERRPLDPALPVSTTPVRIGRAVDVAGERVDVVLDAQDLRRHLYVEGKSGSGKSALLKSVAISWLDTGHPLVVLDPHGDVAEAVAARCAEDAHRRTHYIRHGDVEHPIGINLLAESDPELWDQNVDALLESMARSIDPTNGGMFGERAKRTFWIVADAARHVYGEMLTIQIVQTILLRQNYIRDLANAVEGVAPDAARRLMSELSNLSSNEWNELVSWYQSRFQMWQRTQALRSTTGIGVDAIDMVEVLNGGVNLIVDLASMQLGDSVSGVLGGLYMQKLRHAMGRRAQRDEPVLVVFDEAHLFQDEAPDRLLAEGRKYGLALLIASQSADNLTPRLARSIEANVGSFISLRTGINLAPAAASRLGGWSSMELTRLPDLVAAASLSSGGVPTDPFTLTVDYYSRSEAMGWDASRTKAAAAVAARTTLDELWLPHADVKLPTDEEIVAALHANRVEPPRAARPDRSAMAFKLDQWLADRSASLAAHDVDLDATEVE